VIKLDGEKVDALEWISSGATYRNLQWFETTSFGGRAHPYAGPYAFEGHPNQFLAILSMSDLPLDHELRAGNSTITIGDMVENAKKEVNSREEVTWTLWALSHYLPPDAAWRNKLGESWSIERMVQQQTREGTQNAACGGTHGLFALAYARNMYLKKSGQPLRGVWLEADQKIRNYVEHARALQNSDGTFSSNYFRGQGYARDVETRLATTGHTLEFIVIAVPEKRLKEEWLRRAVQALTSDLIEHRAMPLDCGPLYHAVDGLAIYRDRTRPIPSSLAEETAPADEPADAEATTPDPAETASKPEE
jgi:hypothetical protein